MNVPEPLADILKRHCNVNGFTKDWGKTLLKELKNHKDPLREKFFKEELTDAIFNSTISPKQYEDLTGEDFDTQEELNEWLKTLWKEVFGEEPIQSVNMMWSETNEKIKLHEHWVKTLGKDGKQLITQDADFRCMDLSNRKLSEIIATGCNFDLSFIKNADLYGSNLASTSFMKTDLSASCLSKVNFDYARLATTNLSYVYAIKSSFYESNLISANLQGGYFVNSNFIKANMSHADLRGTNLEGVSFKNACLEKVDLTGARIMNTNFDGTEGIGSIIAQWILTKEQEHEKVLIGEDAKKFLQSMRTNI